MLKSDISQPRYGEEPEYGDEAERAAPGKAVGRGWIL
jgi:hypothetical protein